MTKCNHGNLVDMVKRHKLLTAHRLQSYSSSIRFSIPYGHGLYKFHLCLREGIEGKCRCHYSV